jgi:hypothetical protein
MQWMMVSTSATIWSIHNLLEHARIWEEQGFWKRRGNLSSFLVCGCHVAIDPGLAAWLVASDGPDVVGFTVDVPSDDLDNVKPVMLTDNGFPASSVEVVVREVDEL